MASKDVKSGITSKQGNLDNNLKSNSFKDKIKDIDDNILKDMEKRGGHTLSKHAGKDSKYLNDRLKDLSKYNPSASATTYTDADTATKAVKDVLNKNINKISKWLENPKKSRITLYTDHNFSVGEGVAVTGVYKTGIQKTVTVLEIDNTSPLGFKIITSYPKY